MRILHLASGLPSKERPFSQPFIKSQIDSLIREGLDIEVYDIKGFLTPSNYIKAINGVKKIIIKKEIDLIHAHYSYCGFTAVRAKTDEIPVVLSLMGNDILGNTDKNGKFTIRGRFDKSFGTYIANKVDHIIIKSEAMRNKLNINTPISVIPNGVNFQAFRPINQNQARIKLGLSPDDFIILFLGNPDIAVKNFRLAKETVDYFIKINGYDNVKFISPFGINHDDVVYYMNAANVLLFTSFMEGSPNVIKESMACNLPIISTDVGDVSKIIHNTFNCFICDFSEKEISEKINIIYRNRLRSNGRDNIGFLRDDMIAKQIIEIYQNTINKYLAQKIFI